MSDPNAPPLNAHDIFGTLDRHHVNYVLVGGFAAIAHGATRVTRDIDVVPENTDENLERLAHALKDLNAGARVDGMTERVPRPIDAHVLRNELTTWRTDAGDIDIILWLPGDNKTTMPYDTLAASAAKITINNDTIVIQDHTEHQHLTQRQPRPQHFDHLPGEPLIAASQASKRLYA